MRREGEERGKGEEEGEKEERLGNLRGSYSAQPPKLLQENEAVQL